MKRIASLIIRFYQVALSPLTGSSCRYYPTCSNYALEAYEKYSFVKATRKSIWRILRCNPFSKGGIDHP